MTERVSYTVKTFSSADSERVSSVGDARQYGRTSIEVRNSDGELVAEYRRERHYGGAFASARIEGITYFSAHKRSGHRTLRAWFIDEIKARYGVVAR